MAKMDIYERVTNKIIETLEAGIYPWERPWDGVGSGFPVNATSERDYNGINVLLLWATARSMGYAHDRWLTFKQAKKAGGSVMTGEKATMITYWNVIKKKEVGEGGEEVEKKIFILKHFNVFNVEQCENLPDKVFGGPMTGVKNLDDRLPQVDAFFEATGSRVIESGNRAFYETEKDHIQIPPFDVFESAKKYYSTLAHEHAHWTGSDGRTARHEQFQQKFGDDWIAAEELVAEISSAFTLAQLGLSAVTRDQMQDHANYIGHWIKALKVDPRLIFTVVSKAKAATKFLVEKSETKLQQETVA